MTASHPDTLRPFYDWFIEAVLSLKRINPEEFQRLMADLQTIHEQSPHTTWEQLEQARERVLDSYQRENLMLTAQLETFLP